MLPELRDRALSVVRARLGQQPFMQKNLPKYAPDWIRTTTVWANASKREVHYPVCDDRRTLVWLANQRAVEYHPALMRVDSDRQTHLILDLDPPDDVEPLDGFRMAVAAALLVRQALEDAGLSGGVKTSGAKGVHVFVPLREDAEIPDVAAATRAAGGARRAAGPGGGDHGVRPRGARRQGVRRLHEGGWRDRGGGVQPAGAARRTGVVPGHLGRARAGAARRLHGPDRGRAASSEADPWAAATSSPQALPADLVAEGHEIPIARVVAMHEGKRRKREEERHQAEAAAENASSPGGRAL